MKKLILSSDQLKWAVNKLGECIHAKPLLPALGHVLCNIRKGQVEMITTDTEITAFVTLDIETKADDFSVLLPYDFLHKIAGVVKSEPLTFDFTKSGKVTILTENDSFDDNSLFKIDEFPKIPAVPKLNKISIDDEFVKLLNKAMLTVAKGDSVNPVMTCSCLDIGAKETNLVSTDGYFLFKHKVPFDGKEKDQLLFSPKLAKAINGIKATEISWTEKLIAFKGEKATVVIKRMEGRYVNYKAVIPSYDANLVLNKALFVDALLKAAISTSDKKQTVLLLKKTPGTILFETEDSDKGRMIHGAIAGEYKGKVQEVVINSKKMLTLLSQVEDDSIHLAINNEKTGILIQSDENKDYLGMLMPIVLNN